MCGIVLLCKIFWLFCSFLHIPQLAFSSLLYNCFIFHSPSTLFNHINNIVNYLHIYIRTYAWVCYSCLHNFKSLLLMIAFTYVSPCILLCLQLDQINLSDLISLSLLGRFSLVLFITTFWVRYFIPSADMSYVPCFILSSWQSNLLLFLFWYTVYMHASFLALLYYIFFICSTISNNIFFSQSWWYFFFFSYFFYLHYVFCVIFLQLITTAPREINELFLIHFYPSMR